MSISPAILNEIKKLLYDKWEIEIYYDDLGLPQRDILCVATEDVGKFCEIYDWDGKFFIEYDSGESLELSDKEDDDDKPGVSSNIIWEYEYGDPKGFDPEVIVNKLYSLYCRDRDVDLDIIEDNPI